MCRQFLHLGRNNGKALARLASTGGLNGCVQSQKVGLLGNGLDKDDDFTNLLRSFIQAGDLFIGQTSAIAGLPNNGTALADLTIDFANGSAQLFCRGCNGLDVCGRLFGRC